MGNCALITACSPPARRSGASRAGRTSRKQAPELPLDMLLEIVARADAVTLIRCAAASKYLRRHITDTNPTFLHNWLAHAGFADAGFVPCRLLGMFQHHDGHELFRFVPMPPATKLTVQIDAAGDFFRSFTPVTSRAGLVLLRRVGDRNQIELCVWSPITGRHTFVPPPATLYDHSHLLLPGDEDDKDTGHSFRLLVVDDGCRTQAFSSATRSWGEITENPGALPSSYHRMQPAPVVLERVAYWLYHDRSSVHCQVLAICVDDGQAVAIGEIPERCLEDRRRNINGRSAREYKDLLLVSTDDGKQLGLLVADTAEICMWTLSEDSKSWGAPRVVADLMSMVRLVKPHCNLKAPVAYVGLEWFGEASRELVLKVSGAGILVLNLRTREVDQFSEGRPGSLLSVSCCPYEVDLVSLLAGLRPF